MVSPSSDGKNWDFYESANSKLKSILTPVRINIIQLPRPNLFIARHQMALFQRKPDIEKLKAKNDVKGLIKALSYKDDPDILNEAIKELGRLGEKKALIPLITLLDEKGNHSIKATIEALGKIGDVRGVKPLIPQLKKILNKEAAKALVNIGTPAVDILLDEIKNDDKVIHTNIIEILIQINDQRAVEPILAYLKENPSRFVPTWDSWIDELITELMERNVIELNMEHVSALYWIYKDDWRKMGPATIPLLEAVISARSVPSLIQRKAVETLGHIGGAELVIKFLQDDRWDVRRISAKTLNELKWKPNKTIEKALFFLASGDINKLTKLSNKVKKQILFEFLETELDDVDFYIKKKIAQLVLMPDMDANETQKEWAKRAINDSARKYSDYIENRVAHVGPYEGVSNYYTQMFEDYADLFVRITSYGSDEFPYDVKPCLTAMRELCKIERPMVSNLLHHFAHLKDREVKFSTNIEVEYSIDNPIGMAEGSKVISFKQIRNKAIKELDQRGNPDYDFSVYNDINCWHITEE